jgi:hypothetical protein
MKQPKRRKRMDPNTLQLIRQIVGGFLVLFFIALLVTAVWYVTRLPALTIATVDVSGGQTIQPDLVRTLVSAELEGEYLRLVPRRFSLLYPKSDLVVAANKIDRIKDVQIERRSLTSIAVTYDEFVPDALWCTRANAECVFLDATGYAFAKAPTLSGGAFLRFEKLDVAPVTGVQAFATAPYQKIHDLVDLLEDKAWFVSSVTTDSAGDAFLQLTKGGELKVALSDEPAEIVDNLFTVLASPEFAELGPGAFEYVDLRFGNKVFVNELDPVVATSSEDALE